MNHAVALRNFAVRRVAAMPPRAHQQHVQQVACYAWAGIAVTYSHRKVWVGDYVYFMGERDQGNPPLKHTPQSFPCSVRPEGLKDQCYGCPHACERRASWPQLPICGLLELGISNIVGLRIWQLWPCTVGKPSCVGHAGRSSRDEPPPPSMLCILIHAMDA